MKPRLEKSYHAGLSNIGAKFRRQRVVTQSARRTCRRSNPICLVNVRADCYSGHVKTNAVRILEQRGVAYRLANYEVGEEHADATSVARKVGMPPEQVFKTLVCRADGGGLCFAIVPANTELDLKVLAKAVGERKASPVPLKEVQPLTGYVRGGVTVLGAKKAFRAVIDATALLFEEISVSAGARGTQVILRPQDYVAVTQASVVEDLGR